MTTEMSKGRPLPAVPSADSSDSGDIANMATTDTDSAAPRRPTISSLQNFTPRRPPRSNSSTCTHLTMTRLYTKDFRCSVCLKIAPMGWLYRCSQDRELLLEEDIDRGTVEKMDKICDLFEPPAVPPKRSPLARMDRLSFLDEITDEQLKSYSKEQLNLILKQRAEVLEKACEPDDIISISSTDFPPPSFPSFTASPSAAALFQASPDSAPKIEKPWLPLRGGECQFKCCARCRPGLQERAFLSLGGIADGDIPVTAILGFGFHLNKKRPVALVKHVRNLGLRPVPFPRGDSECVSTKRRSPVSKKRRSARASSPSMGLGIFASARAAAGSKSRSSLDSGCSTSTEDGMVQLGTSTSISVSASTSTSTSTELDHSSPSLRKIKNLILRRRHRGGLYKSSRHSLEVEVGCIIPLPAEDDEEVAFFAEDGSEAQAEKVDIPTIVVSDGAELEDIAKAETALSADEKLEEVLLTPMEEEELSGAHFSSQPLEVPDGVALLEESIELHVPDVITQF